MNESPKTPAKVVKWDAPVSNSIQHLVDEDHAEALEMDAARTEAASVQVSAVRADVRAVIEVRITGAPEMRATYLDRVIQPDFLSLMYKQHTGVNGSVWRCVRITVDGHLVLEPGSNGEQRTGKDRHVAEWSAYGSRDLAGGVAGGSRRVPEWLLRMVGELRPHGDVTTANSSEGGA